MKPNWILKQWSRKLTFISLIYLSSLCFSTRSDASSFSLITNGDFETGDLTGWNVGSINDGNAFTVQEGRNFSFYNTTGFTLNGDFAVNVRSSGSAPTSSVGILTSDPFVIGNALRFSALSETRPGILDPVNFEVHILDSNFTSLFSETVQTNLAVVGFEPTDGTFSSHLINTSALVGQEVRLQFRQNTKVRGSGFFTLIDDVETTKTVSEPSTILGSLLISGLLIALKRKGDRQ